MRKSIIFCFIALISFSVLGQESRRDTHKRMSKDIKKTDKPKKEVPKDSAIFMTAPMIMSNAVMTLQKTYKLKITLTDVQCLASSDSDKIDDYGIQQHIFYKANGKIKRPISKDIRKFKDNCDDTIDEGALYLGELLKMNDSNLNSTWKGANALLCGDYEHQLHVREGNGKRTLNVNNSMIFEITESEYKDENAEMIINTTVSEYNSLTNKIGGQIARKLGTAPDASTFNNNNRTYNYDGKRIHVSIRDVLDALIGVRALKTTKPYFDSSIAKGIMFDNFDGFKLPLTQLDYDRKTILEGVLRARGATSGNKAALWMRFELVD